MVRPGLTYLCWILFGGLLLFLSMNRHSRSGRFNYHSEIWGDKAGYYVYLPTAFIYDFNARTFPDSIAEKTGNGFQLDTATGVVSTKYPMGTAVMQLPFFLAAHATTIISGIPPDGFTVGYHKAINVAAVVYLMLGLWLLSRILVQHGLSERLSASLLLVVLVGTNLYYYAIWETGMSHVYSFFLFSCWLYSLFWLKRKKVWTWPMAITLGSIVGLCVMVRPTNLLGLLIGVFVVFSGVSIKTLGSTWRRPIWAKLLYLATIATVLLPQLVWWHWQSGQWLYYAYGDEGFNWFTPALGSTWFSPNNGLFLYNPLWLVLLVLLFINGKSRQARYALLGFFTTSYVFACWWDWGFGCSYGARSFVEYLPIISLPALLSFPKWWPKLASLKWVFMQVVFLCVLYNLKMAHSFDQCFYGDRYWDWEAWWAWVASPIK